MRGPGERREPGAAPNSLAGRGRWRGVGLGGSALALILAAGAALPGLRPAPVLAASAPCTASVASGPALRAALDAANRSAAPAVVCLDPGTFRANLDISRTPPVTLRGSGAGRTVLRPADTNSILSVGLGARVTVIGLTVTGGLSGDPGGLVGTGAGIHSAGDLTLEAVAVSGNGCALTPGPGRAPAGSFGSCADRTVLHHTINAGGIYNTGRLTLIATQVDDNSALEGAGIMNNHAGTVVIEARSRVNGNGGPGSSDGAGIYNHHDATLVVSHSTVADNRTEYLDSSGGGIFNQAIGSARGRTTVIDSVVSGNQVGHIGGGILNRGWLTVRGSTVQQNVAGNNGGGILNVGSMTVTSTRLLGNAAGSAAQPYGGGAIYNAPGSSMALVGSTVAGNQAHYGAGVDDEAGAARIVGSMFTANGCLAPCADPAGFGALFNDVGAVVTAAATTISGNTQAHGALFDNYGSRVEVSGGAIEGNRGGGIYNQGHAGDPARLTVDATRISANTGAGGVLNYGDATLVGVDVTGNRSITGGGGIDNAGRLSLSAATLVGNRAGSAGGGLLNRGGEVTITGRTVIQGNTPDNCSGLAACIAPT